MVEITALKEIDFVTRLSPRGIRVFLQKIHPALSTIYEHREKMLSMKILIISRT